MKQNNAGNDQKLVFGIVPILCFCMRESPLHATSTQIYNAKYTIHHVMPAKGQ